MNHRLFLRVTAPALAVGLLLFGACFAGIRYINRLETNLTTVLSDNVACTQAAQELEICVRQLRYHSILYLTHPVESRLTPIVTDQRRFLEALELVDRTATDDERRDCVRALFGPATNNIRRNRRSCAPGSSPACRQGGPISRLFPRKSRPRSRSQVLLAA